jgi:hypothetical protein
VALRGYEKRWAPEVESALGEPVMRCIAMNAAGVHSRMRFGDDWGPSMFSLRPFLLVDGEERLRLPATMFLTLTPSRVLITETKTSFLRGFKPRLDAPILVLQRGDAKITTTEVRGVYFYLLQSRSMKAQLELELLSVGGLAAELAQQLQEFSV